jgi:2-dehydropantoate 2-reductase
MNIIIFGAGAIGSYFGSMLSKNNNVLLIGRKPHIKAIKKNGLKIEDKTNQKIKIEAETSIDDVNYSPDLVILTVKSYDTESAIKQVKKIIKKDTILLSLQNGLDNIEKIKKYISIGKIIAGITTHGVIFNKPGFINHTGYGETILGELNGKKTKKITDIVSIFNKADIPTSLSNDIFKEIWIKGIINSSINPLTTFFNCKNGYLLKNPILEKLVEKVCIESTNIAILHGIDVEKSDMIKKTKDVIRKTSDNYSSMLQSFNKGKKTEIMSINGKLVDFGKKYKKDVTINTVLINSVEKF